MRLLGYHLRLAWRSILRDRWYSLTMVFVLGLASGVSTLAFNVWLENGAVLPRLAPSLHHVEIGRPPPVRETINRPIPLFNRSRVSYPDYQRLAASGIPAHQTASAQARVLVRLPTEARAQPEPARFVSADFFAMFQRELAIPGLTSAATTEAALNELPRRAPVEVQTLEPRSLDQTAASTARATGTYPIVLGPGAAEVYGFRFLRGRAWSAAADRSDPREVIIT
jgi:hypothetical protein